MGFSTTSEQRVATQPKNWISHELQMALLFLLIRKYVGHYNLFHKLMLWD